MGDSRLKPGVNDLKTKRPDLLSEWNFEKNKVINPSSISAGSHKKVWWRCSLCNHEWETPVYVRGIMNCGCPKCDGEKRTSFPEQAIGFYLSTIYEISYRTKIEKKEIDIFIPKIRVGIEYDGYFYHRGKDNFERENRKNDYFKSINVLLIRVKELKEKKIAPYVELTEYGCVIYSSYSQDYLYLNTVVPLIIGFINKKIDSAYTIDVDVERDKNQILSRYIQNIKENSLGFMKPLGVKKWDYEKNKGVDPFTIPYSSKKRFNWKCPTCGSTWTGAVENCTDTLTCSKCVHATKKIIGDYKITSTNPEILNEWNYEKNTGLNPRDFTPGSNVKVWWKCQTCGYEWSAPIKVRTKGHGCPICGVGSARKSKYKKVTNLDTGEIFESVIAASEKYNVNRICISNCCNHKAKTAGGYRWEFVECD